MMCRCLGYAGQRLQMVSTPNPDTALYVSNWGCFVGVRLDPWYSEIPNPRRK